MKVLPVWTKAHTGSVAVNKRKNPTTNYPEIETSSDTMLRIVGGGEKRWRLSPLYIIQAYLT
jgi:hypothetical protein